MIEDAPSVDQSYRYETAAGSMIEDAPGAVMIISLETRNAVDGVLTVLLSFFFHCHFISEFDHHLLSDDFSR